MKWFSNVFQMFPNVSNFELGKEPVNPIVLLSFRETPR